MSARAVGAFGPVLREVEAGLALPIPERVRILRELEADLTDLSHRLEANGLPADEARLRAREALVPNGEALRALHHLHTPLYRRMTRHVTGDRLRLAERSALVLLSAGMVLSGAIALVRLELLQRPSPFLWPALGLGGVMWTLVLAKAFRLWVKGEETTPSRGLGAILGMAGVTLFVGIVGATVDLFRMAALLERAPDSAQAVVLDWLVRDAGLLSVCILLALAGGLAWFVLAQWVTLIEEGRRQLFQGDGS